MPRKKEAKGKPSASDFIRTQPRTMTAPQVVEAGKKQGLKFSQNLVYAVRAAAKKKSKGRGPGRPATAGNSEAAFRRLVVDLGIGRARTLVADVDKALARVING